MAILLGGGEVSRWATWLYHATVKNDGITLGNHEYDVTCGVGSRFEFGWGTLSNRDLSNAHNWFVIIQDALDCDQVGTMATFTSITAGVRGVFPDRLSYAAAVRDQMGYGGTPLEISGGTFLHAEIQSLPINEDTEFSMNVRVRGAKPTVAITSPAGADETVNFDRMV